MPKNHRILVLPSGGATGLTATCVLSRLEEDTGRPIHELFDEIWASSVGSIIASFLTAPNPSAERGSHPRSALEAHAFLEQAFATYHQAFRIRGHVKKAIGQVVTMSDTLIPLRILTAQVTSWKRRYWPASTKLRSFSRDTDPSALLASVVAASCTVFPVHPKPEAIQEEKGSVHYHIDPGSQACTETAMNPLWITLEGFLNTLEDSSDTVAIYFLSNGWVRLTEDCHSQKQISMPNKKGHSVSVTLYNLDLDLLPALKEWSTATRFGRSHSRLTKLFPRFNSPRLLHNLAGAGAVPSSALVDIAVSQIIRSEIYLETLRQLQKNK